MLRLPKQIVLVEDQAKVFVVDLLQRAAASKSHIFKELLKLFVKFRQEADLPYFPDLFNW